MCLRHGRREGNIGSSKEGIKCTCGLKGKMTDWVKKEMKEKSKALTDSFELDTISRSRGLIFIGQLEIHCPLRCNIRKYWDSMDFVLKIRDREIFNTRAAPSKVRRGATSASNWGKSAEKMTTVDVQLNVPVNHLFAKLIDIYNTITEGILTCLFELSVTLRLPIIGEFPLDLEIQVKELNIPDVLGKSLSFISEPENHPGVIFHILSGLYKRHYVSPDVLESCLSKTIFHDDDTTTYYVARMALDIYKHKSVGHLDPHDLGKFLSKLFMKGSHEETGGVVTSSKKREEEMGVCVARMALDIYNHKEVSSDDLGKFLAKLFKLQEEEEENMGVYVARMALDFYNHKSVDPHDLGKLLSKLFMKMSHEETGGVVTGSKKREEEMGVCVAHMVLDIYNQKEVSSDDLGKFLSKLFKSQEEEEENMGVYAARMALDLYNHKSVNPHDLGKFLSELFMKASHEETGGVVTSSKEREEEMGVCVARMALDIYNQKEVSSDDLGKFLAKLFKSQEEEEENMGVYVARMVLDFYNHKSVDDPHDLGKLLSKLFMKMSHEETGGVVTGSKKREEEMGFCVARMALDIYNHKEISSDDWGKFLSKLFKSQEQEKEEENMGIYVARMALDFYNHKSVDPHDLGKFLSKLFMKMSQEETGGIVTGSKKREEEMGVCVAHMVLDIYNQKKVSSDDLGKFLSKLFKSEEEEEEIMGVYGYVARMALDRIYNHKEEVSSGDLGKFLSILFKWEEKTGDYVAQIVLDLYKGKVPSRPAMEGLIEIIFKKEHPKVYLSLLMGLDAYEGNDDKVNEGFTKLFRLVYTVQ